MAVGGFNGTDPAPTLAQFQALVAASKIHYFVGGGTAMGGRGASTDTGGSDDATRDRRVGQENFAATTVGGTTVYDLTGDRLVTARRRIPEPPSPNPPAGRTVDAQVRHNDRTAAADQPRRHEHRRRGARPASRAIRHRRHRPRRARRRRPRLQRGDRPRAVGAPAARPPAPRSSPTASGSRSPTTPAPTPPRRSPPALAGELAAVTSVRLEEKGRGRALRTVWAASDAAGARLLRRRPVDRPGRAAPAGRPADLRALRPRDRHPAGAAGRGWSAARSGSSSPAATTCCCAARCRPASPTRSAASRRSAPTSRARLLPLVEDTGWFFDTELLVLAERAGPADPRGAGRLGGRPRLPRRHRRHRDGRPARHLAGSAGRSAIGRAAAGRAARAARPARRSSRACPGVPTAMPRQLVRFAAIGVASTLALPAAVPAVPRRDGRDRGERRRAARSPASRTPPPTGG